MPPLPKKILVTGADGFIGSHLVERLVERGAEVTAFVMYNSFNSWGWLDSASPEVKRAIRVVAGDIRDFDSVRGAMKGTEACLHLAALIAIPFSYLAPENYFETNVRGTLNVVRAARDLGLHRVVHTSTSEVYGTAQRVPIDEAHPLQGQSPYSASKIGADQTAYSFYCSFGVPVVTVRPFNTFGPRQSARAVIPTVISQLVNNSEEILLGAVTPTRDFTYVSDTADGLIAGICAPDEALGRVINLGTGYEIAIGDLVALIAEIAGRRVRIRTEQDRLRPEKSEVERLLSDNRLAKELLNWAPKLAGREGLREGLEKTISWFSNPENLRHYKTDQYNL